MYIYMLMQGIKTAKKESYPTFCNDLVKLVLLLLIPVCFAIYNSNL